VNRVDITAAQREARAGPEEPAVLAEVWTAAHPQLGAARPREDVSGLGRAPAIRAIPGGERNCRVDGRHARRRHRIFSEKECELGAQVHKKRAEEFEAIGLLTRHVAGDRDMHGNVGGKSQPGCAQWDVRQEAARGRDRN